MPSMPTPDRPVAARCRHRAGRLLGLVLPLLLMPLAPPPARAQTVRILVQDSPLAGSQYYALESRFAEMRVGDALTLTREPDNRHDRHAVRVDWRGAMLGYLPRAENQAVANAMNRGLRVEGRIAALAPHPNPWQRLRVEVWIVP